MTPLLGRTLRDEDEQAGAPRVAVIRRDVWQNRLHGDPAILGTKIRLGAEETEIVGVVPEKFGFPVAHGVWVPLRVNALEYKRREGPEIAVLGRLASGATLAQARAELGAMGQRRAAAFPDTHEHIRPQIDQYPRFRTPQIEPLALGAINLMFVMLLMLISSNVALLMFARAAARESELVVRNALGSSRGHIVSQLFAEALVLGGAAAIIGLVAAHGALQWWLPVAEINRGMPLPFWFEASLKPATIVYALGLTLLGAFITGVLPALKVTGAMDVRLRAASAGGGGPRFGGVWAAVIIAQVAATVAFPAAAFLARRAVVQAQTVDAGFPMQQYLSARLELDADPEADEASQRARLRDTYADLVRRAATEPAITGVTFTDRLPRTQHPLRRIELDEEEQPKSARPRIAAAATVDVDYFRVLGAPALAGRTFDSSDLEPGRRVVIANQAFARSVFGGRNPVGRRIRYAARPTGDQPPEPEPWYEIVGVVPDLGTNLDGPSLSGGLYHPAGPAAASPFEIIVHVRGEAAAFAPLLRSMALDVDPSLQLHALLPLDQVGAGGWIEFDFLFRLLLIVCAIALLLSLTAIYSVTSFAVSRRTREIGIRVALGSDARRIVATIFGRALLHVGIGVIVGSVLVGLLSRLAGALTVTEFGWIAAYAVLMMAVCMLACAVPTRRALRIQPMDALKIDS